MAFNGSGTYTLPGAALTTGATVSSTENNTFRNDVATAFNKTSTRDGQTVPTANLPMGGFKHTGLAAGTTAGDSVRFEQLPSASNLLPVASGGTGATDAATAVVNLGALSNATNVGFKNRIINGAMMISQRGTSFSTPATGAYTLDRYSVTWTGAAPASIAQVSGPTGYKNALQITGAASNTQCGIVQKIESFNCSDLSGATVTIQANIAVSSNQNIYWQLSYANAQDNFSSATVISGGSWSATSTATVFSTTISGLPAGAVNGLQLALYANNAGAFTSGTVTITGVQLEKGSTATSFDYRPYGTELALCQRYYEKSYPINTAPGASSITSGMSWLVNGYTATIYVLCTTTFKATKRTSATVTFWDAAGNTGRTTSLTGGGLSQVDNNNNIYATVATESGFFIYILAGSSLNYGVQWTASAEL